MAKTTTTKKGASWRGKAGLGKLGRKRENDERPDDTTRTSNTDAFRDSWEPRRSINDVDPRRL